MALPASYTAVHRYDGAMLQRDKRRPGDGAGDCRVAGRDIAIVRDLWRYRFLDTEQLAALHFPGRTGQAVRRRLAKLFHAGYLDRFRPYSRQGSYPWTYQLAAAGHKLLQETGHLGPAARYQPRLLLDYSYVVHDLQLNAWIIAYRNVLGDQLIDWHGETPIQPPPRRRQATLALAEAWTPEGLKDPEPKPVFPDSVLTIQRPGGPSPWTLLIEHDRTRRVDKNFDKFRRYDNYLTAWHHHATLAHPDADSPAPYVIFICQTQEQRQAFMHAADHELTGHRAGHAAADGGQTYPGRKNTLFVTELDMHQGTLDAMRLPDRPPGHPERRPENSRVRRVRLPGPAAGLVGASERESDVAA
jgi:Replication-relaxation